MLNSLIKYEQIITTLPKAKELKPKIDKLITLGKKADLKKKKISFLNYRTKILLKKFMKIYQKDMRIEKVDIQEC